MPPIPKFPGLAKLIGEAAPALAREGAESVAAKTVGESMGTVPGNWQKNIYNTKGFVEELPIEFLEQFKGNVTGKTSIPDLKASIQERGLDEPLILSFDPETKRIKLGEGNHRLEALKQLGYTKVPVRAIRSYVENPQFSKVPFKPSTDPILKNYYPADMKPSDVIDFNKLSKIAEKTSTPDEKAYLDMIRQQMAEQEAFKAEFNLPLSHGTNMSKTGNVIEKFIPSTEGYHGPGIYAAIRHPEDLHPISNMHTNSIIYPYRSEGGYTVPLVARGNKIFNMVEPRLHDYKDHLQGIIPTTAESYDKLEKIIGKPIPSNLSKEEVEEILRQYPEHFEGMLDNDNAVRIFEPKNVRMPWAEFDPAKKSSGDTLAGLAGATAVGATALGGSEAKADTIQDKPEPDLEDKAMEYLGKAVQKAEPVLKVLGYPGGLVRGGLAGLVETATGRDDLVDINDVLKGEAPSSSEIMEKLGVEKGGSLSDVFPSLYSETGKGLPLQKDGLFDPSLRGVGGLALDVVTDPLTYLAGTGIASKGAKALSEGLSKSEIYKQFLKKMADESGELTLPQMRKVAKLMGKNPTEAQLAEAAELPTGGRLRDYIERRNKEVELSDFAHKERLGIPHDTPGEQVLEKVKGAHTELTGPADVDVIIDPDIANFGEYRDFGNERRLTSIPSGIFIKNPNKNPAGVLAHELGHAIDAKIFPFAPWSKEILPSYIPLSEHPHQIEDLIASYIYNNKYNTAEKILALNPNLSFEEAYALARNIEKMSGNDAFNAILNINKDIINAQDISKAGHHYRYPRNFEMQRTMELLDPNKPFSGPSLAENARIISEVSQANPSSAQEAVKLYTEKGFPNIKKLLEEINRYKPPIKYNL